MKNRGSILQIVLVLWSGVIIIVASLMYSNNLRYNLLNKINIMMKQKNIEIIMTKYYTETMKTDFLLSDCFSGDGYFIEYNVEDMISYYTIETHIEFDEVRYGFTCKINTDDYKIISFVYI